MSESLPSPQSDEPSNRGERKRKHLNDSTADYSSPASGEITNAADAALASAMAEERQLAGTLALEAVADAEPLPEHAVEEAPAALAAEEEGARDVSEEAAAPIDLKQLERTVEALLFAAAEPVSVRELARATETNSATIRGVLKTISASPEYAARPWQLSEVANAWRLVTRPEFHPAILRLKTQTSQRKLTQAALETLALIAYKQPLGRAEIESVRGVNVGPVLRLLLEKKLIQISGRGTGVGQPLLYGTTDHFLENFGLKSVQDLPKPGEFKNA